MATTALPGPLLASVPGSRGDQKALMLRKSACRQTLKVGYDPEDKWQEVIGQLREVDRRGRGLWAQDGVVKLLEQQI